MKAKMEMEIHPDDQQRMNEMSLEDLIELLKYHENDQATLPRTLETLRNEIIQRTHMLDWVERD